MSKYIPKTKDEIIKHVQERHRRYKIFHRVSHHHFSKIADKHDYDTLYRARMHYEAMKEHRNAELIAHSTKNIRTIRQHTKKAMAATKKAGYGPNALYAFMGH